MARTRVYSQQESQGRGHAGKAMIMAGALDVWPKSSLVFEAGLSLQMVYSCWEALPAIAVDSRLELIPMLPCVHTADAL